MSASNLLLKFIQTVFLKNILIFARLKPYASYMLAHHKKMLMDIINLKSVQRRQILGVKGRGKMSRTKNGGNYYYFIKGDISILSFLKSKWNYEKFQFGQVTRLYIR